MGYLDDFRRLSVGDYVVFNARTDRDTVRRWSSYIPTPAVLVETWPTSDTAGVRNLAGGVSFLPLSWLQHAGPPTTIQQVSRRIVRELQK
jgi:hypothetical protein